MSVPVIGNTSSGQTNFGNMFRDCKRLQKAPYFDTSYATSVTTMFSGCNELNDVPLYNTHLVTNFGTMFRECFNLRTVPLYDMYSATDVSYFFTQCYNLVECPPFKIPNTVTLIDAMFQNCYGLRSIPYLNFSKAVGASYVFNGCTSLTTIPSLDFSSCLTFLSTFNGCSSLTTIPAIDTSKATILTQMFVNCFSLQTVPPLDTHLATSTSQMYDGCRLLRYIPTLDLSAVTTTGAATMFRGCYSLTSVSIKAIGAITSTSAMFQDCYALTTLPLFSTSAVTTAANMFVTNYSLKSIPQFDFANCTVFTTTFGTCPSLSVATVTSPKYTISYDSCSLSATELTNIINSVGKPVSAATLTLTNNWGNPTSISLSAAAVAGSTTMLMASTTGLATGMEFTGVGSPLITPIAVTMQGTGDTVTLTSHGLSNNDEVSFATIVTTTGITINVIYYVISSAANTFQLSLTVGGAAIDLVTDGSGTIRYRAVINTINTNTSVVLSRPATSTNTSTKPFHTLAFGTALLRGWTVTG